ncbi:MAG: threonine ammonia-lyase, partial [Thermoanaerobaculia bacterium]
MSAAPPPVRSVTIDEILAARERIRGVAVRTPLVRLLHGSAKPEIWLKLENLQPINAFKIRGAANAVALLDPAERARGVWTISAGNAGQGVAYAARVANVPCTVVVIETAAETKVQRMRDLGARLIKAPFDACWQAMEDRTCPGVQGTFVHPFDDHDFIAGNATLGVEILEDLPDVKAVV